jgi:hypothetical protein
VSPRLWGSCCKFSNFQATRPSLCGQHIISDGKNLCAQSCFPEAFRRAAFHMLATLVRHCSSFPRRFRKPARQTYQVVQDARPEQSWKEWMNKISPPDTAFARKAVSPKLKCLLLLFPCTFGLIFITNSTLQYSITFAHSCSISPPDAILVALLPVHCIQSWTIAC